MEYIIFYDVEYTDGVRNSYTYREYNHLPSVEEVKRSILNTIQSLMMMEGTRIPYAIGKTGVIDLAQVKMINVDVRSAVK